MKKRSWNHCEICSEFSNLEKVNMIKSENKMSDAEWTQLRELFEAEISRKKLAELFQISAPRISQMERDGDLHAQANGMFNLRDAFVEYCWYLEHRSGGVRPLGS